MKKLLVVLSIILLFSVVVFTGCQTSNGQADPPPPNEDVNEDVDDSPNSPVVVATDLPNVQAFPMVATIAGNTEVVIAGVGFEPNRKVSIRFVLDGAMTEAAAMMGGPVTNESGSFEVTWLLGRTANVMEPGVVKMSVRVEGDDKIVNIPLVFREAVPQD